MFVVSLPIFYYSEQLVTDARLGIAMFVAGAIASLGGIMKVHALRNIDSTIFFPLFKLLSPLLAIILGVTFFAEAFTTIEWLGMVMGLTVPLLLINNAEHHRQQNLVLGLLFVVLIAITSASAAAVNKYAIDLGIGVLVGLWFASVGVFAGTIIAIVFKSKLPSLVEHMKKESSWQLVFYAAVRSILICVALGLVLFAYATGGTLSIVQTIHSLYILIPIVLSIILYNEHWNAQKMIAVVLSIAALGLLG